MRELSIEWSDGSRQLLSLEKLRLACPCAGCHGEKDVFGNIYKSPPSPLNENSFLLKGVQPVGYYAIRHFWNDGHHSGIYSFEMLRTLCENQSG